MDTCNHSYKRTILITVISIILIAGSAFFASASIQQQLLYTFDDTYVNASATGTNYDGQGLVVNAGGGGDTEGWFRFNLADTTGYYVLSSVLYLYAYANSNSRTYFIAQSSSNSWTENNLTWANKPSYGGALTSMVINTPRWASWDISSNLIPFYNNGSAYASYALYVNSNGNIYAEDKENSKATGNVPYLNLTLMTPEAYLLSPPDSTSTYNTSFTFQYNTTDVGNLTNCSLVFDGDINKTNTTLAGNTTSTFTLSNVFPGSHTWSIRCYDVNRVAYQMNSETRTLDIVAVVEWKNPSSSTPLDLGSAVIGTGSLTGTRDIYSNNSNTNVALSCGGTGCSQISTNWTTRSMSNGESPAVEFTCSDTIAGSFEANFALTSDQDATADTLSVNCTILAPDLRINSTNITFSDDTPTEDENVTITAGIYNDGTYTATNALVRIYEGEYGTGTIIGGDNFITLAPGQYTTVQASWISKIGNYSIYAYVDPPVDTNGTITEGNETNNYAYKDISINMWTIFLGNISGKITLGNNQTLLLSWTTTNLTGSLIYVSDSDSNIDFSALVALSRDKNGNYISGDLAELDGAINTTQYPDSINKTYMSGANPKKTETFTIFGKTVSDVPIINSTNSSTFVSGILWDSSDDSNDDGQFDNTAQEDIVFVTRVNQSKQGRYGNYDYEIKIPARLKSYKTPDSRTVSLYAEIK